MEGPFGQAVEGFIESLDQAYSEILAEEVRRGMTEAVRRGRRPGGIAPFGYRMTDAVMEIRDDEAAVIRLIAELRNREGLGVKEIAHRLNSTGVRTRRGTRWTGTTFCAFRGHAKAPGPAGPGAGWCSVHVIPVVCAPQSRPGRKPLVSRSCR